MTSNATEEHQMKFGNGKSNQKKGDDTVEFYM